MKSLAAYIGAARIGTVHGNGNNVSFEYDEHYRQRADATPLSTSMPTRQAHHGHQAVHPFLWGLLPDDPDLITRWARQFQCSPFDVVGLLTEVGADVAGAVQFVPENDAAEEATAGHFHPLDDKRVATLVQQARDNRQLTVSAANPERWSLAGAQAKVALHRTADGQWGIATGALPTTHILKPSIATFDNHDINEHLCLSTARNIGLPAAHTTIHTFATQRVLIVERYDRAQVGDDWRRVHQEDFCQALSVHPANKYESDGGPSVADLASVCQTHCPAADRERLFLALVFNWVMLATDAHAKNYSLLLSGPRARLAPLYDIASAAPYQHPAKARLAQKIGGERRFQYVKPRHWERAATSLGVTPDEAHAYVSRLTSAVPDAFADALAAANFSTAERAAGLHLQQALTPWWKSIA